MRFQMYVVENTLMELYDGIQLFRNDAQAQKSIVAIAKERGLDLSENRLYAIGEFDNETGRCVVWDSPRRVTLLMEVKDGDRLAEKLDTDNSENC